MKIFLTVLLTICSVFATLKIVDMLKIKKQNDGMLRQSQIHSIIKFFIVDTGERVFSNSSQLIKHRDKNKIKAVIIDNLAYWISDNVFYTADVVNGEIVSENAKAINIDEVSQHEVEKLLFILDNLRSNE